MIDPVLLERRALLIQTLESPSEIIGNDGAALHEELLCPAQGNSTDAEYLGIDQLIDTDDAAQVWLALSVLTGRLPSDALVAQVMAAARTDEHAIDEAIAGLISPSSLARNVKVVTDRVLVDVAHTVGTTLTTGIQRVSRECAKRWDALPETLFIQFVNTDLAYRTLTESEHYCLLNATIDPELDSDQSACDIIVPWHCTYFSPELPADNERAPALAGLSHCSPNRVGVIGHDAIPITTGETTVPDMPSRFALFMSALRAADLIVATCQSSAAEFKGWRAMVRSTGVSGPEVAVVQLPTEAEASEPHVLDYWRRRLLDLDTPMVLVVGSHEPRKNHLAILAAAERMWQAGEKFCLLFIGGSSWKSEDFNDEVERLQNEDRSITLLTSVTEELLWAAYRLARFSLFPSLNEGFGLPVAESLAVGTPVITTNYGSMAEIAAAGGALVVDPRNDRDIQAAMTRLLHDDNLLTALREQALTRTNRTWDQYAREVWAQVKALSSDP